jgi:hypothetical protein
MDYSSQNWIFKNRTLLSIKINELKELLFKPHSSLYYEEIIK